MTPTDKRVPLPTTGPLGRTLVTFRGNLDAIRIFTQEIGALADERDRDAVTQFATSVRELFADEWDLIESEPQPSASFVEGGSVPVASQSADASSPDEVPSHVREAAERVMADGAKRRALFRAATVFTKRHPRQGDILRRSAVVSLMSHVESLIADLIHAFYELHPGALPADERSLTLAELRSLGSMEEAQTFLVAQEVDSVLREPLERQLAYFTKRPRVDLGAIAIHAPSLVEVDQRRNLYVHNRGRVNPRYLAQVRPEIVAQCGAKEGADLKSGDEYVATAIDTASLVGVALGQLCWRKWAPSASAEADADLITALYDGLLASRWKFVAALAELASAFKLKDDETQKIVAINGAIALARLQDADALARHLDAIDWSSCGLKFRVAVHLLRGEEDSMYALLRRAVAAEEIRCADLRDWPLFAPLRTNVEFQRVVAEICPGESLDQAQDPPGESEPKAAT